MPISGTTQLNVSLVTDLINSLGLGTAVSETAYAKTWQLTNGTGANQAQAVYAAQRTLAASTPETLDLNGVLLDAFGATVSIAKVKALVIYAAAANVNDVVVGGVGANAFISPFGSNTDKINVKPGGMLVLIAPDANGYAVTASTADLLKVLNGGAGTSVTYDIIVIGV